MTTERKQNILLNRTTFRLEVKKGERSLDSLYQQISQLDKNQILLVSKNLAAPESEEISSIPFSTKEIMDEFDHLDKLTITTEAEKLAIEKYKTVLLNIIYNTIEHKGIPAATVTPTAPAIALKETQNELERLKTFESKTEEDEWYASSYKDDLQKTLKIESIAATSSSRKAVWNKLKKYISNSRFMKYLSAAGLAITKFTALLIVIQGFLTNALPSIFSLFSLKTLLVVPAALISINALAIGFAIVGTYYFLPFALVKLGLISPADETLNKTYLEQLELIQKINKRLLESDVSLNSEDYNQLTHLVNNLNGKIVALKETLPEPKKNIFASIASVSIVAINAIIAYGSALSFAHSIAFLLASIAVFSPAAIPIVITVLTIALCVGLFAWLQFVVGPAVHHALHPDVANADLLKKNLENFTPTETVRYTTQHAQIKKAEPADKKQIATAVKAYDATLESYKEILQKTEQEKTDSTATSYKDILSTIRLTKAANANKIKPANEPAFTPKTPTAKPVEKTNTVVLPDDEEKESPPETESPKSAGKKH